MMRASVVQSSSAVTSISMTPVVLSVPAKTSSPALLSCGTDSPVTGASLSEVAPLRMTPSSGTRSPGRMRMCWPSCTVETDTSSVRSPFRRCAVSGASLARPWMELEVRRMDQPSSHSPI